MTLAKSLKEMNEGLDLYIDFDNTIVNSSEIIVNMLNEEFGIKRDYKKLRKYDFTDLFPKCTYWEVEKYFNSDRLFTDIKLYNRAKEVMLWSLKKFDKTEIVTIGTEINLNKKRKWIDENISNKIKFSGILNDGRNVKSSIDMSNGILIDDHIDCLRSSNAKIKILLNNTNGEWNQVGVNDEIYVTHDWYEIESILKFIIKNEGIF